MSRQLKIIRIDGQRPEQIATLTTGEIKVGREPGPEGIKIPSTGVSREHGMFVRCRNHWLFKDFGSTNGSWIGGRQIRPDHWGVIRKGTILQLADTGFTFEDDSIDGSAPKQQSLTNFPALGGRSVLVFKNNEFIEEYPVPEYGKAVIIGGREADLAFGADASDVPALVVERRGEDVVVYQVAKEFPALHNSEPLSGTKFLSDGDELEIQEYSLLFNDPQVKQNAVNATTGEQFLNFRGWDDEPQQIAPSAKPVMSQVFGTSSFKITNTSSSENLSNTATSQFNVHNAQNTEMLHGRWPDTDEQPNSNMTHIEDKIVIGVGLAVVFAVIMLGLWWLFL